MSFITPNFEILHGAHISKGIGAVASAAYGNGRTEWDYHVSAWWPDRFKHLAEEGHIHTLAGSYRVWDGVEIVRIITLWRPHSPYEVTAIFRKPGGIVMTYPTWLDSPEIIGEGFLKPSQWRWKNLIESRSKLMTATRVIKRLPILGRLLRAARDRMLKPQRVGIQDPQWGV